MTVLYGSSVADTTLTTACKMSTALGGTETSKTTDTTGAAGNKYSEVFSQGGTSNGNSSIPATPTGHGWVFSPGAGTFALGNWSASITLAFAFIGTGSTTTLRIFKYSSGTYTSIGTITATTAATAKTVYSFAATSMAAVTFSATDLLYFDLWSMDGGTDIQGDNPVVYETTSATAGKASDMQVTTSTFSTGNVIIGGARAKFVEAIASSGKERAKFLLSIAQKAPARNIFKLSIGSKQASRSKFTVSIAVKGRSRSLFTESIRESGRGRSRFYSAAVSKGWARSRFLEAATQLSGARARFLLSFTQRSVARARFLLSIGHKAASRAKYLISKASKGLARAKFTEAIAQRGQARSRFSLSAVIRGLAESTFKIAVAGGHAITAYMRSRYKVSIRQAQAQRSKYLIRFFQTGTARSLFKSAAKTSAQARSLFLVRFGITGKARSHYLLSIRQPVLARSRFITRLALAVRARSRFLVQGILITLPIKSITHAVYQVLSAAWNVLSALGLTSSHASALTLTRQELAMPAPNSTILPTITVTDISGALVSNASVVSLVVYFPDGTTSNLALGSGITNLGAGQYQAKYNTKQPGEIREVWSIVGADGTTLASAQFLVGVEY